jgi:hypothetical protein
LVTLTVQDTLAPLITLNGSNPLYVELGGTFTDPGAVANDLCMGAVQVSVTGAVNPNTVGTNSILYSAGDGNGNTNTATRSVIVRDTTPPTISSSFTNLILAADTNCTAVMPDVTGTNYITATDLSGPLTISQTPTNNSTLTVGTNIVVLSVADFFGNTSWSTNQIVVADQAPPSIGNQPQSQTNSVGGSAVLSVTASACTPLTFQWFFANSILAAQTNTTLTVSNLTPASAGDYFAVITSAGGSSTSQVATLTVNLLGSSLVLTSSENPSGFKDNVSFATTIIPTNATGSVQFFSNGVAFDIEPIVAGQAVSTNLSSLPRGTNLISAVYPGDVNTTPSLNTLAQIVTNHPPTATGASYMRTPGAVLNIAVTNLAANWSDVDGDAVSLVETGVSTNGVIVTSDGITLVYANTNNVDDQFVCTISDGWGGTNFQTVNISVAFLDITSVVANPDGSVTLGFAGGAGSTYILQSSTDLFPTDWLPLVTNSLGLDGLGQFTDSGATNFQQRFYRLQLAP